MIRVGWRMIKHTTWACQTSASLTWYAVSSKHPHRNSEYHTLLFLPAIQILYFIQPQSKCILLQYWTMGSVSTQNMSTNPRLYVGRKFCPTYLRFTSARMMANCSAFSVEMLANMSSLLLLLLLLLASSLLSALTAALALLLYSRRARPSETLQSSPGRTLVNPSSIFSNWTKRVIFNHCEPLWFHGVKFLQFFFSHQQYYTILTFWIMYNQIF